MGLIGPPRGHSRGRLCYTTPLIFWTAQARLRFFGQGVIDHPHDRVKGATGKGPFWVSDRASIKEPEVCLSGSQIEKTKLLNISPFISSRQRYFRQYTAPGDRKGLGGSPGDQSGLLQGLDILINVFIVPVQIFG